MSGELYPGTTENMGEEASTDIPQQVNGEGVLGELVSLLTTVRFVKLTASAFSTGTLSVYPKTR